jgi:hypothetical protein
MSRVVEQSTDQANSYYLSYNRQIGIRSLFFWIGDAIGIFRLSAAYAHFVGPYTHGASRKYKVM